MAGLPLWQFLNQKAPVDDNDSGSPQQSQTNGQSIGQSLIDFWNRAAAGFGTSNGNFSCLPPTESWLREHGQSLPSYPSPSPGLGVPPAPFVPPNYLPSTASPDPAPPKSTEATAPRTIGQIPDLARPFNPFDPRDLAGPTIEPIFDPVSYSRKYYQQRHDALQQEPV